MRAELGYADYLGALQRYRVENLRDPHLLTVSAYLINYPFANRLFPGSLDVIENVPRLGADGHPLGRRCRLPAAQDRAVGPLGRGRGQVLIYIHKEQNWTMSSGAIPPSIT